MKNLFILFLFVPPVLFTSCAEEISSDNVETAKILRNYYAHSSSDGKTYVTAEFFADAGLTIPPFGEPFGKNITLSAPSKVLFNDQEMEMKKDVFGAVSYRLSFDRWPNSFRWDWTDKDGKTHTDEAKMEPISLGSDPLAHEGGNFVLRWEGDPVAKGEEIYASLKRNEESESAFIGTTSNVGGRALSIPDGGYTNLTYFDFKDVDISRTFIRSDVKEISTENVAGSCIKLVYRYEKPISLFDF